MKLINTLIVLALTATCVSAATEKMTVTAYCNNNGKGCTTCNGKWAKYHKTADGHTPTQGVTIAASRRIPFGTKIKIKGHVYTVQDRLSRKQDTNHIDIYFNLHKEALNWGKKTLEVEVLD